MARWDRLVSALGAVRIVLALGIGYFALALLQLTDGVVLDRILDASLFALLGVVLLFGAYLLGRDDVDEADRRRVVLWCLGGSVLLFGLLGVFVASPTATVDEPQWALGLASAVGAIGGLGIGLNRARAVSRARELERRNRELRRYETLFEESTDVNAVLDAEGRFQYVTPSVEHVLGYEPEDLVGEIAFEYMHPEDRADATAKLAETIERGHNVEPVVFRFEHADGSWIVLEGDAQDLTDDPRIEGIVAYTHDVTERERRELELSEYETVLETASDVVVTIDEDSVIRSINPAVAEVFGYERDAVIGESLTMLMPEAYRDLHDEGLARYLRTAERRVDWEYLEFPGRHAGGHDVPLAISFSEHRHQGERFFTGIIRDNTERKRLEESLRDERDLRERIVDTSPIGIAVLDCGGSVTFLNERGERLLGRTRDELNDVDRVDSLFTAPAGAGPEARDDETTPANATPYESVLADGESRFGIDLCLARPDGTESWISLNAAPILDDGEVSRVVLAFEDVTDRRRSQERLVLLNELSRNLADAETREAVADLTVEAATETLPLPHVAVAFYDDETGDLEPATRTEAVAEAADGHGALQVDGDVLWRSFVDQTEIVAEDLAEHGAVDGTETPLRSVLVLPLGDHGVFLAGATCPDAFTDTDVSLASMLVASTRSALDRVAREATLRERTDTLEEKNDVLQRLQRINDTIRGITTELIRASTREEVLEAVCAELASAEAYSVAWIGTRDPVTDEIVPEAWAGREEGYLDAVTVTAGEDGGPAGETAATGTTTVRNRLATDPPFEPWRQAALERDFQAIIAVPLTYQDATDGVLCLAADRANVFDRTEAAVLTELGETIGYALNALDRKRALVGEESVELEFRLRKGRPAPFQFAAEHDCEFTFENVVQRADGRPGLFFTVRGVSPEVVLAFGERSSDFEECKLVREDEDGALYECRPSDSAFFLALLDRGAMPQTLTATGTEGRAVIRIPRTSDVRTFVDLFAAQYEECELVGRREVDEPIKTEGEFRAEVRSRLTERQREILETAYVSGFFDWPREITAQDLAGALDLSQPTVSRHLRTGERELFGLLFDRE